MFGVILHVNYLTFLSPMHAKKNENQKYRIVVKVTKSNKTFVKKKAQLIPSIHKYTIANSRKVEPQFHPPLYFNNVPIKNVTTHKHLGLTFSNDGSWTTHINEIITKASSRLNIIRKLKSRP